MYQWLLDSILFQCDLWSTFSFQKPPLRILTECDPHGDSIIGNFVSIETISECRNLCYDTEDCEFITYYGDDGFPMVHFCQLHSSCEQTVDCTGCVSETRGCFYACSDNVIGSIVICKVISFFNFLSLTLILKDVHDWRTNFHFISFFLVNCPIIPK